MYRYKFSFSTMKGGVELGYQLSNRLLILFYVLTMVPIIFPKLCLVGRYLLPRRLLIIFKNNIYNKYINE